MTFDDWLELANDYAAHSNTPIGSAYMQHLTVTRPEIAELVHPEADPNVSDRHFLRFLTFVMNSWNYVKTQ